MAKWLTVETESEPKDVVELPLEEDETVSLCLLKSQFPDTRVCEKPWDYENTFRQALMQKRIMI